MAFLKSEWKILGYFVAIVGILLAVMANANPHSHWSIAIAFILGAVLRATAGLYWIESCYKSECPHCACSPYQLGQSILPTPNIS